MNMNLFLKELRKNALSLIIWTLVVSLLIGLTMSVYRTFLANQTKVFGMMSILPKGALQFKGISNIEDLLSAFGFYSVNNIIYMMVLGSIFSIVLASNILLREEYNKTAEYLLSWPLTRDEIFLSKAAVLFLYILLLNMVATLVGFISIEAVKNGPFHIRPFLILSFYTLLVNVLFGAIGLFISTLVKRSKPVTTFSIGLVLIFYFLYTFSKITESASKIGYLTPFKYANMDAIKPGYSLEAWRVLFFTGISLLLFGLSYRIYKRKDIYL